VTTPRRFQLDVQVRESGIDGSITDEEGRTTTFSGWLGLIAALQPSAGPDRNSQLEDDVE
jgi:hypothetical protein